ncbi:glutamate-5-semialdehyde dehydrogenase [Nitrospirales bacterium NOB]|nr:MAG: gamma-glutamylphosphate reductase [Nitrospira sp. OLB3]MBV6469308.1 Gamma-glutamyl phosphate reductase [Nitrospirota bacterium]MCE7966474.1 glutamate-5-semialdehyde dehydrogenase [Nitrospira sp. NTP2]MCK6494391.1 glutamate-5-semialdehyde dehydrogenase [Nitrospira sp.]MDL1890271.1 glutamate-5-semialdehyde dehydrogenase [Nitrospirales bacterium NOB]MEB2339899.1 glutamate-5-semialdehyde dehydrogenase [Nitrospirales bacterium]
MEQDLTQSPATEQPAAPEPLSPEDYVATVVTKAKGAAGRLASLSTSVKNQALQAMADALEEHEAELLAENEKDLEQFDATPERKAMGDRLRLTAERIKDMAAGIRDIARLPDPLGEMPKMWTRPNGMQVGRMRVPIGVIGIIYEARPNVTADSAALCLKSGNVCILRGGSEAIHSNTAVARILSESAEKAGVPAGAITFVDRPEREVVHLLLKQDQAIDLLIPRGGESLMKTIAEHATIPVLKHDKGVCHIYVDADADPVEAERICLNAKVQRPSTCNAMETLLVHQSMARLWIPALVQKLTDAKVEVRGCPKTIQLCPEVKEAAPDDFGREFLDLILAIKIVKNMDEALEHIATYGSRHTEAILTKDYPRAMRFVREVDAAAVLVNASTRLNDGYQFGLGAEIGISTSRLHARGPMGLEELTCFKFVVLGSGQIRE